MSVPLQRHSFSADVNDAEDVRIALMDEIRTELRLRGEPHPRVYLVGDGYVDTLDLHRVATTEPDAHLGATLALVRTLAGVQHTFVLVQLHAETHEGERHSYALLGALDDDAVAWFALPYVTEERSGIGEPGEWAPTDLEFGANIDLLRDLFDVPPDAKPASVLQPRRAQPDIRAAFFELPQALALPADARGQADLTVRVAVEDMLKGSVAGTVIVKQVGHHGEMWVLNDAGDLDDAVRSIALREPAAEGIAVVLLALWEGSEPAQKGVQIVAERDGARVERWFLLDFPEGASGRPAVARVVERLLPLDEGDGWIGVAPDLAMDFFPLGGDA